MIASLLLSTILLAAPESPGLARFLFPALRDAALKDGSAQGTYSGPGSSQLRISQDFLKQRDDALRRAEGPVNALLTAMAELETTAVKSPSAAADRLRELAGKPLDGARGELLAAWSAEEKRLALLKKALQAAAEKGTTIPDLNAKAVDDLARTVQPAAGAATVDSRMKALRGMASALGDYLLGDVPGALAKMKAASEAAPHVALAHVYLGSFCFLLGQLDAAVLEWERALELDPDNLAVRQALREHGGSRHR